jgi:hypothetical protein
MNKKRLAIVLIALFLVLFAIFPVSILADPHITPSNYLDTIPYIKVGSIILITPTSTIFVFLLGFITLYFGIKLYQKKDNHTKRLWGLSLILWGIGTILAGTSYQGLGYELKCRDQLFCLFTSWFELSYLFVTAISITVMAYAVSNRLDHVKFRENYQKLSLYGLFIYSFTLLIGVIFEIYFLITYEYFIAFFLLYFVSFFIINLKEYKRLHSLIDRKLIVFWLMLLMINILYFAYFYSGIAEILYLNHQIWFSANDVLHIGLIGWMTYIYRVFSMK